MTTNRRTPAEQDLIDTASKLIRARDSRINTERTMRRLAKALQAVRAEEQNTGAVDASRCEDGAGPSRSPLAETQRNHCGQAAASVPHSAQADALIESSLARREVSAMGASLSTDPGGSAKASAGGFLGGE